jgi:uncharacterized membrane protein
MEWLVDIFKSVPPPLATLLLAMLPVGELRGALPVAILVYKLPLALAIFLSILGNILPVYFLLMFFEKVSRWLMSRYGFADKFFQWLFERTRRKLHDKVQKYGYWALAMFVAIPLPVTGAWTGTLGAFVFGLPRKKSFFAILAGVCVSAAIVTVLTLGGKAAVMSLLMLK